MADPAPQSQSKLPAGALLLGKFRVVREIGRGGMAAVYEAEQLSLGKHVALKVLASELAQSTIVIERFFREARAAASVKSPYIVDVYDSGRLEDGRPFIAMELLEGESLYDRMARVRLIDGPTTVRIISQCAKGLAKAHAAGIVHRDLKPENIFLVKSEDGEEVSKILDFGLAKFYSPMNPDEKVKRLTREGAVFGTPAYMSPEQVKGLGNVDQRADLWALGCMAYECLTGRPVWNVDQGVAMTFAAIATAPLPDPSKYRRDLPPKFQAWFARALQRDPDDRFQSAKELAENLAEVWEKPVVPMSFPSDPRPVAAPPPSPPSALSPAPPNSVPVISQTPGPPTPSIVSRPQLGQPGVVAYDPAFQSGHHVNRSSPPSISTNLVAETPKSSARIFASALFLVASSAAAILVYVNVLHPQLATPTVMSTATATVTAAPTGSAPVDDGEPKWVTLIGEGQKLFAAGETTAALKKFQDSQASGGGQVAKTYLEEVTAPASGACKMVAFARPRYGFNVSSGRPTVSVTTKGAVLAWSDNHEQKEREHVYSLLLDGTTGKAISPVRDLTPEAQYAYRPQVVQNGEKAALLYWDAKGREAGVRLRSIEADGRIAGASMLVGAARDGQFWPSIERTSLGFFVVWQDDRDKEGEDLFVRRVSLDFETQGAETRLTDYVKTGRTTPKVRLPSVAVAANSLLIVYRLEKDAQHLIERMKINVNAPELTKGLEDSNVKHDREVGDVKLVNEDHVGGDAPQIACGKEGCFIVWHGEKKGAYAAMLEPVQGKVIWRKRVSDTGGHPALGNGTDGRIVMTYYDDGKVKMAYLSRDGVGAQSSFGKISGSDHPRPWVSAGTAAGEWFVAWEENEATPSGSRIEPMVARIVCR